jgi:O-antigen/teichoic acid export membrane protein
MEFTRARSLQAIDPVVGFTVTVGLAIAGAGYWALVGGTIAGAWAGAILAVKMSPYPLRWRYERAVMRIYFDYSWPLFVSNLCVIVLANSGGIATNAKLGLAGVGVVGLASTVTQFSTRLDDIISGTLFPAICAFKDRIDLLRESFAKVNRLALMWAMPFGVGIALFVGDLVHHVLGDRWAPAIGLLQITGVVAAVAHIGFNWDDYYRAEGDTKPIMATQIGTTIAFVAAGVPLTLAFGLRGLGIGIAFQSLVGLFFRAYYLRKLFHGFGFLRHAVRAIVPTVPAVGAVLLARLAEHGARTLPLALAEFASYLLITAGATWLMEDRLLAEAIGYMLERPRRWGSQPDPASAGSRRSAATFLLRAADER